MLDDNTSRMKTTPEHKQQQISITLPERHWVIILALLEDFIQTKSFPAVKELIAKGVKPEELDSTEVSATMGPVFARGIIIKELAARGVMTPKANDEMGIDKLMEIAARFKREGK